MLPRAILVAARGRCRALIVDAMPPYAARCCYALRGGAWRGACGGYKELRDMPRYATLTRRHVTRLLRRRRFSLAAADYAIIFRFTPYADTPAATSRSLPRCPPLIQHYDFATFAARVAMPCCRHDVFDYYAIDYAYFIADVALRARFDVCLLIGLRFTPATDAIII